MVFEFQFHVALLPLLNQSPTISLIVIPMTIVQTLPAQRGVVLTHI